MGRPRRTESHASSPAAAVFGHSRCDAEGWALAESVGRVLAANGYAVVNGGYGGVMEASARGARQVDGRVIGVTCSLWRSEPNPYLTECVVTHSLPDRAMMLLKLATAGAVVLPGGTGTLLELALAWEMLNKRLLPAMPLVCVGEHWAEVCERVISVQQEAAQWVRFVRTAEDLTTCFPPVAQNDRPGEEVNR